VFGDLVFKEREVVQAFGFRARNGRLAGRNSSGFLSCWGEFEGWFLVQPANCSQSFGSDVSPSWFDGGRHRVAWQACLSVEFATNTNSLSYSKRSHMGEERLHSADRFSIRKNTLQYPFKLPLVFRSPTDPTSAFA